MALTEYSKKRNPKKTPEPSGHVEKFKTGHHFVVHKHAASRLHYDFRLELDGVLKSWAVPKGPCLDPQEKRLAVHVEDHPVDYGSFEGTIPEGEYGAGTVMIWDQGEWAPIGNAKQEYEAGHLKFKLDGQKLHGGWALVRIKKKRKKNEDNWLLIKEKDQEARTLNKFDVLTKEPLSAASGRSMEEIADAKRHTWSSNREQPREEPPIDPAELSGAKPGKQPEKISPQLATLVKAAPPDDKWLHEIKFDGYRLVTVIKDGKVRLWTRNGNDWTPKFAELVKNLERLPVKEAILDGEIVVLDKQGISDFQALQNAIEGAREGEIIYYLFDMPFCQGYNLTHAPLIERKKLLQTIHDSLRTDSAPVRYSDHLEGNGPEFFRHACKYNLEGIISKRADSNYEQRRSRTWVKVKCSKRQECVIAGYTDPQGSRVGFGALVVGYHDKSGGLIYCGRVGTGFDERTLKKLGGELKSRAMKKNPFKKPPMGSDARGVHYVHPELVAEIEFSAWTNEGILRHPSFQGLRQDKDPRDVHREDPENPPIEVKRPAERLKMGKRTSRRSDVVVAGVPISNPDRVLYPGQGLTKHKLAEFYEEIANWILPHIIERPMMIVRCPSGHEGECFYQKHISETLPDHVHGIPIKEGGNTREYIAIGGVEGLVALVQLGALEIHPWASKEEDVEKPDRLIFDLDPGPDVDHAAIVEAVHALHDLLDDMGLKSYLKTSGGKGYHIFAPIRPQISWEDLKAFAKAVADRLAKENPQKYLATMSKTKRHGRIFIDYLRTGRGATCVAPYTTRARNGAPVSTPIDWQEIETVMPDQFNVQNLIKRLKTMKRDPWEDFFQIEQHVTANARKKLLK